MKFGMRKMKQQSLEKRPRNWILKDFTSGSMFLKRKQVRR